MNYHDSNELQTPARVFLSSGNTFRLISDTKRVSYVFFSVSMEVHKNPVFLGMLKAATLQGKTLK